MGYLNITKQKNLTQKGGGGGGGVYCRLLIFMSVQTCLTDFLLWNMKVDVLRSNVLKGLKSPKVSVF